MENGIKTEYVNRGILDQIYLTRDVLEGDPNFNLKKRHLQYNNLKKEADKHSVSIEIPGNSRMGKGRARKVALKNLFESYDVLASSCEGEVTEDQLRRAASFINYGIDSLMPYRVSGARTLDKQRGFFVYPEPDKIPSEVCEFLYNLNSQEDPIDRAVYAHFQIARIHPFDDGNGRLSRALQNSILTHCNLPPIIISSLERNTYMDLISEASREYRNENGLVKPAQSRFFNYLALKIWDSLDAALKNTKKS